MCRKLLWVLLGMSLLSACGQSGPLYLPNPNQAPTHQGVNHA